MSTVFTKLSDAGDNIDIVAGVVSYVILETLKVSETFPAKSVPNIDIS